MVEGLEDECIGKEGDAGTSPDMRQKSGGMREGKRKSFGERGQELMLTSCGSGG